jgi:nucleoside-diphosphate-sugar epimerase
MNEHMRNNKPTLVLGGAGKTGRRVAERLTARGVSVRSQGHLLDPVLAGEVVLPVGDVGSTPTTSRTTMCGS